MKNIIIKIILIIAIIALIAGISYLSYGIYQKFTVSRQNPIVTMEVEDYGTIKLELYPDKAPNTVANFICLANRGFYNGTSFHRTIPDFVIQAGSKDGDGKTGPKLSDIKDNVENDKEYNIKGEFIANGYLDNNIKHEKGVISMARKDYSQYGSSVTKEVYNSADSQFFIMTNENTSLDGSYAAFGKVIEGLDIVEKIANVEVYYRSDELKEGEEAPKDDNGETIDSDKPKKQPVVKSVTVETFGVDYGIPETQDVFDVQDWFMKQYSIGE